jgi:3alpha(or 20beta)-hydroxysteroid dehydrogenase
MSQLEGKVAVISGGARGMGAAHAALFGQEGARVVVTDVLAEESAALVSELGENGRFLTHDVTDSDRWFEVVAETESHSARSTSW